MMKIDNFILIQQLSIPIQLCLNDLLGDICKKHIYIRRSTANIQFFNLTML